MLMVFEIPRDTAPPDCQLSAEAQQRWDTSMRCINQHQLHEVARRMRIEWPLEEKEVYSVSATAGAHAWTR